MTTTNSNPASVCAVGIKALWYCNPQIIIDALKKDGAMQKLDGIILHSLLADKEKVKQVKNIHQDTWTFEESESSQDSYRNQLTGGVYRMGAKTMGDVTVNWTIGKYDYHLKAEFLGGEATDTSWVRARGTVEIQKALIAMTVDKQYIVLPLCNIAAREANTDGAISIGIVGTAMEPECEEIGMEYWFDCEEVCPSTNTECSPTKTSHSATTTTKSA